MNRSRLQIAYSLAVLILVPVLLLVNTILLATAVRSDYDKELSSRAELANSVLALSMKTFVEADDKQSAQQKIEQLVAQQVELKNVAVITRGDTGYQVFAADNDEFEINKSDELQYDIVFSRKWPVTKNIAALTPNGDDTRAWNVASPIINENNEVDGIVVSDLLTTDNDDRFNATINRSLFIMIASAIIVTVLLFNHFRFIGYADLLRKQKELNQTMGDFLSVATHELKAPMTIIKGYISNVTDGDFGEISPEAKQQLQVAVSQTDRLNELVQDLLNVSRIEQGRIKIEMQPVEIVSIIRTIATNYQSVAAQKGIEVIYEPVAKEVWVQADPGRVQEIFTNLIDNAFKYTLHGKVSITHKQNGRYLMTYVRDSGIGMTTEERNRLFQRFYRAKNEHTKDISGTGLGLWIIKQYIEMMDGNITVDSLVGTGSEFRVVLKGANPLHPTGEQESEQVLPEPSSLTPPAEDNESITKKPQSQNDESTISDEMTNLQN